MKYSYLIIFLISVNVSLIAQSQRKSSTAIAPIEEVIYPTTSMIKISRKKIPEDLKFTLMNVSYVGWEKGELYLDTTTNDYALRLPNKYKTINIKSSSNNSERSAGSSVWHCFTSEGKPLPCSTAGKKIN